MTKSTERPWSRQAKLPLFGACFKDGKRAQIKKDNAATCLSYLNYLAFIRQAAEVARAGFF
jgi:hypothetical protein